MPFIRYSRDKRGYETTVVLHAYRQAQGPQRTRVLYLFRTPSHVKIGRHALDDEVVEALEHTHPDVSFDWVSLRREPVVEREPRGRQARRGSSRAAGRPAPAARPPVIDDQSLLGRTLGATEAARLRSAYADLETRITRRSRTPEDRDRLLERLARLNPDDWRDEEAVRAATASIDDDWRALAAELPSRRRGSRGGRRRREPSAIMAGDESQSDAEAAEPPPHDSGGDRRGDGDAAGEPADADGPGPAADVPVDD